MFTAAAAKVTFILAARLNASPDPNALPGTETGERLINGVYFFVMLGILLAFLVSVGMWAVGSRSQNYQHAAWGRTGALVSVGAALFAGAAPALVNFFFDAGQTVR